MRRALTALLTVLTLAAPGLARSQTPAQPQVPATAKPSRDVIDSILLHGAPGDEDEPDTAGQPRTAPEPEPDVLPSAPAPRVYTPAPRSQLTRPVQIDEVGKTPDDPPSVRDLAYDTRIRSSFASAQSFQGPLEGGWTLSAGREDLYALQLVDRRDRLEGVWRDVRRKGSITSSGLVDDVQRQGGELTLRFAAGPNASPTLVTLHDGGSGIWSGEISDASGKRAVALRRTGP